MKNLVKHLLRANQKEIVAKSRKNCHAMGLHSVMLLDCPGKTIRLFYASEEHTLWRNFSPTPDMTVGFHSHHCDITLSVALGEIENWMVCRHREGFEIGEYAYKSAIPSGLGGFKRVGAANLASVGRFRIEEGKANRLLADELHTVYVAKGVPAAWFVFEGREDPNYSPSCFSNANLEQADLSGMYGQMTLDEIVVILIKSKLLPI